MLEDDEVVVLPLIELAVLPVQEKVVPPAGAGERLSVVLCPGHKGDAPAVML